MKSKRTAFKNRSKDPNDFSKPQNSVTLFPVFGSEYARKNKALLKRVTRIRSYNGTQYEADDVYRLKADAKFYAKAHRYEGRKARVFPTKFDGDSREHFIVYVEVKG